MGSIKLTVSVKEDLGSKDPIEVRDSHQVDVLCNEVLVC